MFNSRCLAFAVVASMLFSAVSEMHAQPNAISRRRAVRPPASGLDIHPLSGHDPAIVATADLAPFRAMVGDSRVAALGESWHTSGGFYLMKHRLFRYLVQEHGFRALAMESNWEAVERTNEYVQSCAGTAESAISEQYTVWQSREYADLVRWMCEWNSTHTNPADRLTIFGFDIQQPEKDGPAIAAFLQQLGVQQGDPRIDGLRSCEKAFGLVHPSGDIPPSVHATCLDSLRAIESLLTSNRPALVQSTSQEAFDVAMLRVIGLRAHQEETFGNRVSFATGFNRRDAGMAYAFHARRAMKAPGAKTVLWAHNVHIAQHPLPTGEVPLGSHLENALGRDYTPFAITAYEAEVPRGPGVCGLAARTPGSIDERLSTYGYDTLLARPRGGEPQHEVAPVGFFTFRP